MTKVTTSGLIWSESDIGDIAAPHVLLKAYRRLQLQRLMSFYDIEFDPAVTTGDEMRATLLQRGVKIPKLEEFHDMLKKAKPPAETKKAPVTEETLMDVAPKVKRKTYTAKVARKKVK